MKNTKKMEVNDMENENKINEEVGETTEEVMEVKTKMSLKKKLMIGGGVVLGLVLGAVALGSRKSKDDTDENCADCDSESEDYADEATEEESETTENLSDVSDQTTTE